MTWSARILKADGTVDGNNHHACQTCKHGQHDHETGNTTTGNPRISPCYLPKVANQVGSLMTCVDVGADGHMAGGVAELKSNGFEPIEVAEPDH